MLVVAPWTSFWDRNYFAGQWPWLREWLQSAVLRAGVSAVGVYTALAGMREFSGAVVARARAKLTAPERRPES